MRRLVKTLMITAVLAIPVIAAAQKQFELKDPTGKYLLKVDVGKSDIRYSLTHGGDIIIEPSAISMKLTDGTSFGKNPRLGKSKKRSVNSVINPPLYRKSQITDRYNELTLEFKGNYSLVFRAYDDGVAYRFASNINKPFMVESEEVRFDIPANPKAYIPFTKGRKNDGVTDPFYSAFQNVYTHINLSEWRTDTLAFLPVLIEGVKGKKVCITEADLLNYPGFYVKNNTATNTLEGVFAAYPKRIVQEVKGLKGVVKSREPYIAKFEGKTTFPWRVIVVSENDNELLDNDMVYKLATPAAFTDFSWIKPGKVAWEWWNNWNLYGVAFETGINNDTYKYYIDFASKKGIEYVILDEGWSVEGKADLLQVVSEINLPELIKYAADRNVGIILWAGYYAFDRDMEAVCKHYANMGVKGFKIDFMDRDDQYMIDFNRRCAETGARYKLLIDLHGTSKPTGLQRTYPNTINFEGVHGLEELKWAKPETDQVTYDVTMPFIRMLAGPIDYTQGAMNNANKENFRTVYTEPMSQGTRCRQLAEYIIFESPVNMLCDSPTNYEKEEECTNFIASIPTVWDETRPLQSKVSEYITIARRKADVWYVGALTNWDARDMELDLSFLGSGNYKAEIFKDGINAGKVAKDYKREVINFDPGKPLKIRMASGGGYVMKIYK